MMAYQERVQTLCTMRFARSDGSTTKRNIVMMDVMKWIKGHEGLRLKAYKDTVGITTIGYGRNLEGNGISLKEAEYLFNNDIERCLKDLNNHTFYTIQSQGVKDALLNMCFNLGINRLLGFKKMVAALQEKNFTLAAKEALNSKWAEQVGERAKDIALMIRQG